MHNHMDYFGFGQLNWWFFFPPSEIVVIHTEEFCLQTPTTRTMDCLDFDALDWFESFLNFFFLPAWRSRLWFPTTFSGWKRAYETRCILWTTPPWFTRPATTSCFGARIKNRRRSSPELRTRTGSPRSRWRPTGSKSRSRSTCFCTRKCTVDPAATPSSSHSRQQVSEQHVWSFGFLFSYDNVYEACNYECEMMSKSNSWMPVATFLSFRTLYEYRIHRQSETCVCDSMIV